MSDRPVMLTRQEAAKRIHRTVRTLYRWEREGIVRFIAGRIAEPALLDADKLMRSRIGRPRKTDDDTPRA